MLTIWGNADSINVQKVLWCCEEIGLEYRRLDAGRHFGVVDTPEFLRLNPNGLVPTIDDDGFVISQPDAPHGAGSPCLSPESRWPICSGGSNRWLRDRLSGRS